MVDDDDALIHIVDVEREVAVVVELLTRSEGNDEERAIDVVVKRRWSCDQK